MRRILLCLLLLPWPCFGLTIDRNLVWQGEMTIREPVRVAAGATLRVKPGSQIEFVGGSLEVAGRLLAREAEFFGNNWGGIQLKAVSETTLLVDCRIRGARTGLQIGGGAPRIEGVTLEQNRIGIELRRQSEATISGCLLRNNSRVGLFVKDGSTAAVVNNRFEKNGKFGAYIFRAKPRRFSGNVFNDNPTGLMISHYGSDPLIEENCLTGNQVGILVDRAAKPKLRRNDIRDNTTGVRLYRRSDPLLEQNRISANQLGLSIAFSSYPEVRHNDLSGNQTALELEFQSALWERANGSRTREAETSGGAFGAAPQQTVTEADRKPRKLDGWIDAQQNWWGAEGLTELQKLGEGGNPGFIVDGRDRPEFEDGGKTWPLDRVRFAPWLEQPVDLNLPNGGLQ